MSLRRQRIVERSLQISLCKGASDLRIVKQGNNLTICQYPEDVALLHIRRDLRIPFQFKNLRAFQEAAKPRIFQQLLNRFGILNHPAVLIEVPIKPSWQRVDRIQYCPARAKLNRVFQFRQIQDKSSRVFIFHPLRFALILGEVADDSQSDENAPDKQKPVAETNHSAAYSIDQPQ